MICLMATAGFRDMFYERGGAAAGLNIRKMMADCQVSDPSRPISASKASLFIVKSMSFEAFRSSRCQKAARVSKS